MGVQCEAYAGSIGNRAYIQRYIQDSVCSYLQGQFVNEWNRDIERISARRGNGRNKLRTYRMFKETYGTEKYVSIILPRNHRSSYARFRMGVAPLRIETDRYEQLEESKRVCYNCESEVETEEHVLMDCPVYSDLRETLFSKITQHIPDFMTKTIHDKFLCLLRSEAIPIIRKSAKICHDILTLRRTQLYK